MSETNKFYQRTRTHSQISRIDGNDYTVNFEFCRQATNCRVGSSACIRYNGNTIEVSLGSTYANGAEGANLTYVNGDICDRVGPRVTSIILTCSNSYTQITSFTQPITCRYQIEISSYLACPINTQGPKCKIFETGNNNPKYDLTPLKNNIYNVIGTAAPLSEYLLSYSICGSFVTCTLTQPAPAVCFTHIAKPTIAPIPKLFSNHFVTSGKGVSLEYQGGTQCSANVSRQTKINITCDPNIEYQVISAVETSTCRYTVEMKSKHACPKF